MRRYLPLLAVGILLAAAGIATAASGPKATGGSAFFTFLGGEGKASFNAQVDKKGVTKGMVNVQITGIPAPADFKGDVTCYSQQGNFARFSGPITEGGATDPNTGNPAQSYELSVLDQGEPGAGNDRITVIRSEQPASPTDCQDGQTANQPIVRGNIQVHGG